MLGGQWFRLETNPGSRSWRNVKLVSRIEGESNWLGRTEDGYSVVVPESELTSN